jgi:shikimate kinase
MRTADPEATLRALIDQRYPVYALADLTIDSRDVLHDVIVDEVVAALFEYLKISVAGRDAQS